MRPPLFVVLMNDVELDVGLLAILPARLACLCTSQIGRFRVSTFCCSVRPIYILVKLAGVRLAFL